MKGWRNGKMGMEKKENEEENREGVEEDKKRVMLPWTILSSKEI